MNIQEKTLLDYKKLTGHSIRIVPTTAPFPLHHLPDLNIFLGFELQRKLNTYRSPEF